MTSFTFDTYLLFNNNITTVVNLQTDNSFIVDIIKFINVKSRELYVVKLIIKLCEKLTSKHLLNFDNFIIIFDNNNDIKINQKKQAKKI